MDRERESSPRKISQGEAKYIRRELARVRKPGVPQQERDSITQHILLRRTSAPSAAELRKQREEERLARAKVQQEASTKRDDEEVLRLHNLLNQDGIDERIYIETELRLLWFNVKLAKTTERRRDTLQDLKDFYHRLDCLDRKDLVAYLESNSSDPDHLEDHRPLGIKIRDSILPSEQWRSIQKDISRPIY